MPQLPFDERAFQQWYGAWASRYGMNPNPDAPEQHYDYRAAFRAGVTPPNVERGEHWPSETGKGKGHPNRVAGGFDTVTGARVPGTPRAKDAAALMEVGWSPEAAARLAALPEPSNSMLMLSDLVRLTQRPRGGTR